MSPATARTQAPDTDGTIRINGAEPLKPDSLTLSDRKAVEAFARQRMAAGCDAVAVHAELKALVADRRIRIGDQLTIEQLRKLASGKHQAKAANVAADTKPKLAANVDASIAFLRQFHPAAPWAFATFGPGGEVGPAATFDPSEEVEARQFIKAQEGKLNVYFSVNAVKEKITKKSAKRDISEVLYLHVDADLRKSTDWSDPAAVEAEKARVLTKLRAYELPPTAISWSGGGFQGFWRLSENHVVNGDEAMMLPFERRMEIIEKAFEADPCHNADRIMRLVGTINVLGKTKIAAGRKPALAEIIEFHPERVYDIEAFPEPSPRPEPKPKQAKANGSATDHSGQHDRTEYERAKAALRSIPNDDRTVWRDVGMALKDEFGDLGYALWLDWSQSSGKFDSGAARYQWDHFSGSGITIATLFKLARDNGWDDGAASSQDNPAEKTKETKPKGASQATTLADIAFEQCEELFRTPDRTAHADIRFGDHRETWPVKSTGFRHWLRGEYFKRTKSAPNGEAIATALDLIEAHAQFGGIERAVHLRVAEHDGCHYVNLCNKAWEAVEIAADGWKIVAEPPVRFVRRAGMLSLPTPIHGGSLKALEKHLRMGASSHVLTKAWLVAAVRPVGPYPILALTGEQGTAKSTSAKMLRKLVDPHTNLVRAPPKTVHDLYVMAANNWMLAFDNLSYLPEDVADAMCRLSTGGGFGLRALYTNDDEYLFDGQRPQQMNSIADVATRPDVLDRTVGVQLEAIPDEERKLESEVWAAFHADVPSLLGGLYDAVAHGLRRLPDIRPNRLPRMADFAQWSMACETAYQDEGTFIKAYDGFRDDAAGFLLEGNALAAELRNFMNRTTDVVNTTTTDLLNTLSLNVPEHIRKDKSRWPQSAKGLSNKLRLLAPALRKTGLDVKLPDSLDPTTRRAVVVLQHTQKPKMGG